MDEKLNFHKRLISKIIHILRNNKKGLDANNDTALLDLSNIVV